MSIPTPNVPTPRSAPAAAAGLVFAKPEDSKRPYASPMNATDLKGLPPATVITADLDVLRDDLRRRGRPINPVLPARTPSPTVCRDPSCLPQNKVTTLLP